MDEVFAEVIKDKAYYDNSGGGVTFSGGECMLQIDFLAEVLKKCKENGVNTAVDTAGNVTWEYFERILPYTDLFLYDIKAYSEQLHKEGTGVSNRLIFENLVKLSKTKARIFVRIPVIVEFNDCEMQKIANFLKELRIEKVELLPYHALGEHKYLALKMPIPKYTVPTQEKMEKLKELFE